MNIQILTDLVHHIERAWRRKHFWSPGLNERRNAAVGHRHGVRQAEAALDPIDVVAEEAVQRFKSDATAFVGQDLFMFEGFLKSVVIKCQIDILIIERGSQLDK